MKTRHTYYCVALEGKAIYFGARKLNHKQFGLQFAHISAKLYHGWSVHNSRTRIKSKCSQFFYRAHIVTFS